MNKELCKEKTHEEESIDYSSIVLHRNKDTGILEVWNDGKRIGEIHAIGD